MNHLKRIHQNMIWGIYKRNGFYYILKSINGELNCFKGSKSLKEAVEYKDKLIENNWRDNGQLKIEELDDNWYIYWVGKSFHLKKHINGKTKHFGTFKTLEEAIKARDELIMNNWGMLEWIIIFKTIIFTMVMFLLRRIWEMQQNNWMTWKKCLQKN